MPALILVTPGICAGLRGERLRLVLPPEDGNGDEPTTREIPLRDIEHLVLTPHVSLSIPALAELMKLDIPVTIVRGDSERLIGCCVSIPKLSDTRIIQYRKSEDPAFARGIATAVIATKIRNQRRVLQRLAANRVEAVVASVLRRLEHAIGRAESVPAGCLGQLMGIEGAAASDYFNALSAFFPPEAPMRGRTRRPPLDPPNAVLSYGYALLAGEMTCAIFTEGLDPAIGFLHDPAENRAALALDLIEPFRPVVADALAVDLFSHHILDPEQHFQREAEGVHLNPEGRKRFHAQYERRMTRAFRENPASPPTTLRQCVRAQAAALKKALREEGEWTAFRMP